MASEHVESWFFVPKRYIDEVIPTLRSVGLAPKTDDTGIVGIRVADNVPEQTELLAWLQPIARVVRQDSYLIWREDGQRYEIVFRQKRVRKGYGRQPEIIRGNHFSKARSKRTPLARSLAILRALSTIEPGDDSKDFLDHVWEVLFEKLRGAKKWKELAAECARAPKHLKAFENEASYVLDELKDLDLAIDFARRDPESRRCLELLLSIYNRIPRYEDALPIARKLEDRTAERWILFSLARYEEALAIPHGDDLHTISECQAALGRDAEARATLERALELAKDSSPGWRARLLVDLGRADEALALELGDHFQARYAKGLAHLARNEPDLAIAPLEAAAALEPDVERVRFHLACALMRSGKDKKRARALAKKAARGSPDIARRLRRERGFS